MLRIGVEALTLYTTAWCPDCHACKEALGALGLTYIEIDVDHEPEAERRLMELNAGRRSVPTLVYGDAYASMSRFSITRLRRWLREVGVLSPL